MPDRHNQLVLPYYIQQSAITDPREYGYLFDQLPRDIPQLIKIVQGLVIHEGWAESYGLQLTPERRQEIYLRTVPEMLERIIALDTAPLPTLRSPDKCLVGICRDFAVLLVAILRFQGVPARLRIGFAGYFAAPVPAYWDHRITEYWDEQREHWVLVDPQIDDVQRGKLRHPIETLNITSGSPFLVAGEVWRLCRTGQADPSEFGDSPEDVGLPPIRYALMHDFDALNKVELVGIDAWHPLIDKPEPQVSQDDRLLLDEIAKLTTQVDVHFSDLRNLYHSTPYGQAVQSRLSLLQPV